MSRLRFVHAADLHLDSPFTGLLGVDPDVGKVLRDATFEAYDEIIDLCVRERVDALLVAGDIYDGADRSLRAQLRFRDGIERLHSAGIRSFVCHGNHDPLSGWEAHLSLPETCHRFGPSVQEVPLDPNDPGRATVHGVSYGRAEVRENMVPHFKPSAGGGFHIGLLHCNVGSNTGHEPYAPCTVGDLAGAGMDYWALGHVHNRQVLRERGPAIVYPGNPQGRHPNETGARGVYLVDVTDGGAVSLEFRPVDVVRWEKVTVSIDGLESEQGLLDAVERTIGDAAAAAGGRHLVLRLEITGRGPLHGTLRRAPFVEELRQSLNDAWSGLSPFVWCERVRVGTRVPLDREELKLGNDFVACLLQIGDGAREDAGELAGLMEGLSALYQHSRAKRYLQDFGLEQGELLAILDEAEAACLEALVSEETA